MGLTARYENTEVAFSSLLDGAVFWHCDVLYMKIDPLRSLTGQSQCTAISLGKGEGYVFTGSEKVVPLAKGEILTVA